MGVKKYMEDKIKTTTKRLDEKTEFIAVDFFRLLFAIGIVALHLAPMQDINETLNYFVVHVLTRLGVPFFFLVSGFFLQKKIQDVQNVKAYLARIFQLYVIYTVLYLPQIVYDDRKAGGFWVWNLLDFVRNFFLVGSYTQLWYFVGLIVATLLLYWLKNKLKLQDRYIAAMVLVLYAIGTIGNAYIQPLQDRIDVPADALAQLDGKYLLLWLYFRVFGTTRNGLFFGLPYVFFGYLIAKNRDKIVRKNYLLLAVLSFLLMIGEAVVVHEVFGATGSDMLFALLPTSVFILLFAAFIDCRKTERNFHLAKHLRSLSVLYFGLHKWIEFYFVGLLHRVLGVELNSLARFVLVVVLNYIAAEVIIRMSAIRHFQWLRKLY